MGIIVLFFSIAAIIAFVISVIIVAKAISRGVVPLKAYVIGVIISILIYAVIFLNYKYSTSAWELSTYFAFPIFMIIVPFMLGIIARGFTSDSLKSLSSCLLISVLISGIFIVFFQSITFGLTDYLNLKTYY